MATKITTSQGSVTVKQGVTTVSRKLNAAVGNDEKLGDTGVELLVQFDLVDGTGRAFVNPGFVVQLVEVEDPA